MTKLKLYSIDKDIAVKEVNTDRLNTEIKQSGVVENFAGIITDADSLIVLGDSILDEPALDAIILGHSTAPLPPTQSHKLFHAAFVSADSRWWKGTPPATPQEALDRLAAAVSGNGSNPID